RHLRQEYYFSKIPSSWISITQKATTQDDIVKPDLPQSLIQLQEALEKITDEIYITIPIEKQQDITTTLKILQAHFNITTIPDYLLKLPSLPEPTWDIFA
ncbi:9422_t:CDS:1, partial [Paraglomus occultum]